MLITVQAVDKHAQDAYLAKVSEVLDNLAAPMQLLVPKHEGITVNYTHLQRAAQSVASFLAECLQHVPKEDKLYLTYADLVSVLPRQNADFYSADEDMMSLLFFFLRLDIRLWHHSISYSLGQESSFDDTDSLASSSGESYLTDVSDPDAVGNQSLGDAAGGGSSSSNDQFGTSWFGNTGRELHIALESRPLMLKSWQSILSFLKVLIKVATCDLDRLCLQYPTVRSLPIFADYKDPELLAVLAYYKDEIEQNIRSQPLRRRGSDLWQPADVDSILPLAGQGSSMQPK